MAQYETYHLRAPDVATFIADAKEAIQASSRAGSPINRLSAAARTA